MTTATSDTEEAPPVADHVADVLAPLETITGYGFGRYDVFRDWVRLMLAGLQRDDETYLGILSGYDREREYKTGQRPADLFAQAFAELMVAMKATNQDVLGDAYETFGMQNEAFGQHFTPHNIADMMAEMQTPVDECDPEPPVTIADPACGSGRMLIYAARREDVHTISFGQDKDLLCVQMAALNCCFFNMDAALVWGDTLLLEKRRAWITRGSLVGGDVREVDPGDVPWPEASFEQPDESDDTAEAEHDTEPEVAAAERVSVAADGGEIDQADLGAWLDS